MSGFSTLSRGNRPRQESDYVALSQCSNATVALLDLQDDGPTEQEPEGAVQRFLFTMVKSLAFRATTFVCLVIALFGSEVCILYDLPDNPVNAIVDGVMVFVTLFFIADMAVRSLVEVGYQCSFFFLMDLLGTLSMVFEISFLCGGAGHVHKVDTGNVNTVMMRTARATRLGARAGRLSKPMRCLSMMFADRGGLLPSQDEKADVAISLGTRLTKVLSTKVAILTIVLVLGVPLFNVGRFPEDDFSMGSWVFKLEADYARAYALLNATAADGKAPAETDLFQHTVRDMVAFYAGMTYVPFQIVGYGAEVSVPGGIARIPGEALLRGAGPRRNQSVLAQEVTDCAVSRPGCEGSVRAGVMFDFTAQNQYDAVLDCFVILFIIVCMYLEAFDLSKSITSIVVKPLERMANTARSMGRLLARIDTLVPEDGTEQGAVHEGLDEAEMLERIFKKLASLTAVFMEQKLVHAHEISVMDDESKGVFVDMMQFDVDALPLAVGEAKRKTSKASSANGFHAKGNASVGALERGVAVAPKVDQDDVLSWGLNLIEMEARGKNDVILHIFFDSSLGDQTGRRWTDVETFQRFVDTVRTGYQDVPYHSFVHGCDVLASLYRILRKVYWHRWTGDVECLALLLAALAHDIGHPGRTNPFLVETQDEVALLYNDQSPLENMHCARLFEICKDSRADVLKRLDKASYKQARSVAICAILNTDNALHFDMVKEVKKAYEVNAATCDSQSLEPGALSEQYIEEVLCKNSGLWVKLLLHLADVSNPLKTFPMNRLWATRVVNEFFAQGDDEKRLGIPVGMLNDREKVSAPGAEHGFINFLVAPLLFATVHVFPLLHPCFVQMADNVAAWRDIWMSEVHPPPEDVKKRDADVNKIRDQAEELRPNHLDGS